MRSGLRPRAVCVRSVTGHAWLTSSCRSDWQGFKERGVLVDSRGWSGTLSEVHAAFSQTTGDVRHSTGSDAIVAVWRQMSFENCPVVLCLTVSFLCCISCSIFTDILFTMFVLTFVRHFVMLSGMAFMQPRPSDGIYPTVRIRPVKKTFNSIISTVSNTSICSTVGISSTSVGLVILLRNPSSKHGCHAAFPRQQLLELGRRALPHSLLHHL